MFMSIYNFEVKTTNGDQKKLEAYKGKVLLIVNTASKCGYTPQYKELQSLYETYANKGLEVLAFPCNQFGGQEPGSDEEIQTFCELNYNVSFPIFSKIEVNGEGAHPLYEYLKEAAAAQGEAEDIKWNFTKFLIDREGNGVERFESAKKPLEMAQAVEALL
jgi:glutathione peroxidase